MFTWAIMKAPDVVGFRCQITRDLLRDFNYYHFFFTQIVSWVLVDIFHYMLIFVTKCVILNFILQSS